MTGTNSFFILRKWETLPWVKTPSIKKLKHWILDAIFWVKVKKLYIFLYISTHSTTPKSKAPRKITTQNMRPATSSQRELLKPTWNWKRNNSENGYRPRRKPSTRKKIQTNNSVISHVYWKCLGLSRGWRSHQGQWKMEMDSSCKGDREVSTLLWRFSSQEEGLVKCGGLIISDHESLIFQRSTAVACNSENWNLISLFWSQGIYLCIQQREM